jgi:hypothetical protein
VHSDRCLCLELEQILDILQEQLALVKVPGCVRRDIDVLHETGWLTTAALSVRPAELPYVSRFAEMESQVAIPRLCELGICDGVDEAGVEQVRVIERLV